MQCPVLLYLLLLGMLTRRSTSFRLLHLRLRALPPSLHISPFSAAVRRPPAGAPPRQSRSPKSYRLLAFDNESGDDDGGDGGAESLLASKEARASSKKGFVSTPFAYHQELELVIEDVTNLGVGIARYTLDASTAQRDADATSAPAAASTSWVVMVPLVLPGERVVARVYRNHASYSEADLVSVLEPSPDRVAPLCSHFSTCGGCQYQMMSVPAQRRWKKAQVQQLLLRIGGVDVDVGADANADTGAGAERKDGSSSSSSGGGGGARVRVNEVVGTEHVYGYRSKITPHYNAPRSPAELKIGFQQRNTRVVLDIPQCVIATDNINTEYRRARAHIAASLGAAVDATTGAITANTNAGSSSTSSSSGGGVVRKMPKKGATLLFREGLGGGVETDFRKDMQQEVEGVTFTFKAGEFFQNNPHVLPLLVRHVLSLASGGGVTHLIDAYCGSGLFSLCGSAKFEGVTGVEVSDLAVKAATANAVANGIANAAFICGSSEALFASPRVQRLPRDQTAIILDPPRKGCDALFLSQLFAYRPKRIVYVSCDPSTQARDARLIIAEGGYRLTDVTPFDLFPQTRHIESVACFERD